MASRWPAWASSTRRCSSTSSTAVAGSEATYTPSTRAGTRAYTRSVIEHGHQLEALRGRGGPGGHAVLAGKDLGYLAGTVDQRPYDDADHLAQERVAADL